MLSAELPDISNSVLAAAINRLSKEKKLQMVQNAADNSITYKEVEASKSARYTSFSAISASCKWAPAAMQSVVQVERPGGGRASGVPMH